MDERWPQRTPHPRGVYRQGWIAKDGYRWFVQVCVGGHLEYHGSFKDPAEAARVAAAVRAQRDRARGVETPKPIDARRPPAEPMEQSYFGR